MSSTEWTSRAWFDQHADFATRNLILGVDYSTGDSDAALAYYRSTLNGAKPTWPTLDEVTRWAKQNGGYGTDSAADVETLQLALDAAIELAAGRRDLYILPVDANGVVDPTGAPVEVPAAVKLGTIMLAVRVARRKNTPDGIAGTSEITGLIRTSSKDPDIEALLGRERFGMA